MTELRDQADRAILRLESLCRRHDVVSAGIRVAWRVLGQGPKVLLLHGGHGSWLHWARNLEALAQHYEVHVPDMPGYGDSDTLPTVTLDALLVLMQSCLQARVDAQEHLTLIGFSFGGLVAAHLAGARTGRSSLVLMGPAGHGGPRRPIGKLHAWREAAARGDQAGLQAIMRHNLLMHMLHSDEHIDPLALQIHSQACQRTRFVSKPISHAGGLQQALGAYQGRLLALFGEHDVTTDPAWVGDLLTRVLPAAEVQVFEGYGHWVQYEAADAVNRRLLDWLGEVHRAVPEVSAAQH